MDTEKNTFVCPYNKEVDCDFANCEKCGWYPPVAKERKKEIMALKKYKVPFTGYCEVWAKSPEEAEDKAEDVQQQFFAHYDYSDPICLTKEDENELD
jgi:hypothetical protein